MKRAPKASDRIALLLILAASLAGALRAISRPVTSGAQEQPEGRRDQLDTRQHASQRYGAYSTQASDNARRLCLTGFALVVVVSGIETEKLSFSTSLVIPQTLLVAGLLFALGLGSDFLQYVIGSGLWAARHWWLDQDDSRLGAMKHPGWINYPTLFFYWLKLLLTGAGWVLVLVRISYSISGA